MAFIEVKIKRLSVEFRFKFYYFTILKVLIVEIFIT